MKTALKLTLGLSLLYIILAAALVPMLDADQTRIGRNAMLAGGPPRPSHSPQYMIYGIWQRFDTIWYRHVAEHGYDMPESVVFYPLYPMSIRAAAWVGVPTEIGSILVARIATFFFLWGFVLLLRTDLKEDEVRRALALLVAWPMSFVLFGGYAEAFLMCFTVWSLWFAKQGRWWMAAACCVAACMSRAVGMVVLAPLAWMAWQQNARRPAPLLLALSGPLWFPLWLKLNGLPMATVVYPTYWRTTMAWPWTTLIDAIRFWGSEIGWFVTVNALAMLLVFGTALIRPLKAEYFLYALGTLAFILTANTRPPLHSYIRYALPVFPAFASAGRLLHERELMMGAWLFLAFWHIMLLYSFWDWYFLI